jgi:demethylmacrocin O-methyltransferase
MASYLTGLARDYGTDKEGHLYCEHYEAHLGHLQHEAIRLCEIGVLAGASLLMWQAYFTEAEVIGVDIAPEVHLNGGRIRTIVCDVKDWKPSGGFDVVIDDGSHADEDILVAFEHLWPLVQPGGFYVIEDLAVHTGVLCHVLVTLSAILENVARMIGEASEIHLYDNIAFVRKRP